MEITPHKSWNKNWELKSIDKLDSGILVSWYGSGNCYQLAGMDFGPFLYPIGEHWCMDMPIERVGDREEWLKYGNKLFRCKLDTSDMTLSLTIYGETQETKKIKISAINTKYHYIEGTIYGLSDNINYIMVLHSYERNNGQAYCYRSPIVYKYDHIYCSKHNKNYKMDVGDIIDFSKRPFLIRGKDIYTCCGRLTKYDRVQQMNAGIAAYSGDKLYLIEPNVEQLSAEIINDDMILIKLNDKQVKIITPGSLLFSSAQEFVDIINDPKAGVNIHVEKKDLCVNVKISLTCEIFGKIRSETHNFILV